MSDPTYMDVASAAVGVKEVPGTANSPTIMRWAAKVGRFLGIKYDGDHVPWCGLFAAYCVSEKGLTPPSIAIRASAWGSWGVALSKPVYGAVLVFTREGGGHVGFYVSEDSQYYHVLGGNQSNQVSVMKLAKNRCTAIRWSSQLPKPKGGPIVRNFAGPTSTNEA